MHSGASYFDILLCLYFIFIKHFNSLLMKKRIHLRQSISSILKCFSQTYSSPLSIWRRKFILCQASRALVDNTSLPDGIRKIPSPTCFLLVSQPNIEQLAPRIVKISPNQQLCNSTQVR
jgi:hypothetical protein